MGDSSWVEPGHPSMGIYPSIHTLWDQRLLLDYSNSSIFNFLVTKLQEVNPSPVYPNRLSLSCPGQLVAYDSLALGFHKADTKLCSPVLD